MDTEDEEMRQQTVPDHIMFFSFGMFIIDEIEFLTSSKPTLHNLPGGAGLYALLGARLLSPPPFSTLCSWILDAGSDFPTPIATQIQSWQSSTLIRHDNSRLTTRAWNGYGHPPLHTDNNDNEEHRSFKYLTPKRRLDVEDLSPHQLRSKSWHLVCSPRRCIEILTKLGRKRDEVGCSGRGVVVWEPIPDMCTPAELERLRQASELVDVVSPNAEELAMFFGDGAGMGQDEMVQRLMGWDRGSGSNVVMRAACIVREGRHGSSVYFPPHATMVEKTQGVATTGSDTRLSKVHLSAYHTSSMAHQVRDPTGGGNTYLGALALALAYTTTFGPNPASSSVHQMPPPIRLVAQHFTDSAVSQVQLPLITAAICACVAAGFAIEQNGVPELSSTTKGASDMNQDVWGGSSVQDRIKMYLQREGGDIEEQLQNL